MIQFQLTAQDWVDASRLHHRWTLNTWLVRGAGVGMLAAAGVLFLSNDNLPAIMELVGASFISLPVTFWVVLPALYLLSLPMRAKQLFRQTRAAGDLTAVSWDEDSITFAADAWHQKSRWQDFVNRREDRKLFLLYINALQYRIIPKRAFNDTSVASAFGDLVKSKVRRK